MGELVMVSGHPQVKLTPKDLTSLMIVRLAYLSGEGIDPEAQVEHDFCAGLYARTLTVKKGQVVVGALHAQESILTVRKGCALLADGDKVVMVTSGFQTILPIGKMCITYAIEDTIFTNYSANPDNSHNQEELWKLNTFDVGDDVWKTVDEEIEKLLVSFVDKQESA